MCFLVFGGACLQPQAHDVAASLTETLPFCIAPSSVFQFLPIFSIPCLLQLVFCHPCFLFFLSLVLIASCSATILLFCSSSLLLLFSFSLFSFSLFSSPLSCPAQAGFPFPTVSSPYRFYFAHKSLLSCHLNRQPSTLSSVQKEGVTQWRQGHRPEGGMSLSSLSCSILLMAGDCHAKIACRVHERQLSTSNVLLQYPYPPLQYPYPPLQYFCPPLLVFCADKRPHLVLSRIYSLLSSGLETCFSPHSVIRLFLHHPSPLLFCHFLFSCIPPLVLIVMLCFLRDISTSSSTFAVSFPIAPFLLALALFCLSFYCLLFLRLLFLRLICHAFYALRLLRFHISLLSCLLFPLPQSSRPLLSSSLW